LQVIAFASHPAALVMSAAADQQQAGGLKSLASFSSAGGQQDVVAALNARIARETAELGELRAKVAKERERCVCCAQERLNWVSGHACARDSLVLVTARSLTAAQLHTPTACCSYAAASQGAPQATMQAVVDVKHSMTLQDGAFLVYVESAVPLFALALKVRVILADNLAGRQQCTARWLRCSALCSHTTLHRARCR
jgi:hypothetical protein